MDSKKKFMNEVIFLSIDIFGFRALWSPYYFAVLVLIYSWLFLAGDKKKGKFPGSSPLSVKQATYFLIAMLPSLCSKRIAAWIY